MDGVTIVILYDDYMAPVLTFLATNMIKRKYSNVNLHYFHPNRLMWLSGALLILRLLNPSHFLASSGIQQPHLALAVDILVSANARPLRDWHASSIVFRHRHHHGPWLRLRDCRG